MMIAAALPTDPVSLKLQKLKAEQEVMRKEKHRLAAEMRVTLRKQTRLRKRARQMTDDDLVSVLMMRKDKRLDKASHSASEEAQSTEVARSDGARASSSSRSASLPPSKAANPPASEVNVEIAAVPVDDADNVDSQEH